MFLLLKTTQFCCQIITLNSNFGSFTPFILFGGVLYESTFTEHCPIFLENPVIFSLFLELFLIETRVSDRNYLVITILDFTVKLSMTVILLIVRTDIITICDITIGYITIFNRVIYALVLKV